MPPVSEWDKHIWIVLALTLLGGFLRFYHLTESVMFMGDQGRDAIVVSRIFTNIDPVFIGPVTSVGNMYLGPLYYYFMLPFLWLSYPSPMGPVYAVAFAGTLLIPCLYFLGVPMVGKKAAVMAAFLVAFSSSAVSLSRFSWNPNLMPLVGCIWIYCLYRAALGKRWYWVGVSITVVILLQLHYVTLLAAGISFIIWLWRLLLGVKSGRWRTLVAPTLIGAAVIVLFQIPLFLFDLRHDWLNVRQFIKLLHGEDAFSSHLTGLMRLKQIVILTRQRFTQVLVGITFDLWSGSASLFGYSMIGVAAVFWTREKKRHIRQSVQLLLLVILVSVLGLSLYKNDVYLHYLGFLLPIVFLLFGYLLDQLLKLNKRFVVLVGLILTAFLLQNYTKMSFTGGGPRLSVLEATADAIQDHVTPHSAYTVILISESKDLYGMNYRYYLTTNAEKRPLDPEQFQAAHQLFVIWEDKKVPEPLQLPLYELLVFNVATPSAVFDIPQGPTVLELRK